MKRVLAGSGSCPESRGSPIQLDSPNIDTDRAPRRPFHEDDPDDLGPVVAQSRRQVMAQPIGGGAGGRSKAPMVDDNDVVGRAGGIRTRCLLLPMQVLLQVA